MPLILIRFHLDQSVPSSRPFTNGRWIAASESKAASVETSNALISCNDLMHVRIYCDPFYVIIQITPVIHWHTACSHCNLS